MKSTYLYLSLLFFIFSACKKSDVPCPIKNRTLLVYIAIDNSLSNEINAVHTSLIKGLENSESNGTLLIFADSNQNQTPVLIELVKRKGKVVSDTLKRYENKNSASPELFREVIADTKHISPSRSYGLLLFSHASGWLPKGAFRNPIRWEANSTKAMPAPRSVFEDKGREMELADFVDAIPDGMFDFIASEMCFMSSVEIAYALRNKTKYILASAPVVVSPGFRPVYETSLAMLYKREPDLKGFGQKYFDYFNGLSRDFKSAAISLVKTSEMQALADFTKQFTPNLTQEQIGLVQYYDRKLPHLFFDYRDYIAQVATPEQMSELDNLLAKAVLFKRNTPMLINIRIAKHSGLSVYIPQDRFPNLNKAYEDTDWYKATN